MRYFVTLDDHHYEVEVGDDGALVIDGEPVDATLESVAGTPLHALRIGTASHRILASRGRDGTWDLDVDGRPVRAEVVDERTRRLREMVRAVGGAEGPRAVKAPMPGLVVAIDVGVGDEVEAGQGLVIVEAMKMENELRAEGPARVVRIAVSPGDTVEKDQVLVELGPVGDEPTG